MPNSFCNPFCLLLFLILGYILDAEDSVYYLLVIESSVTTTILGEC
jgi:hypothetical protein